MFGKQFMSFLIIRWTLLGVILDELLVLIGKTQKPWRIDHHSVVLQSCDVSWHRPCPAAWIRSDSPCQKYGFCFRETAVRWLALEHSSSNAIKTPPKSSYMIFDACKYSVLRHSLRGFWGYFLPYTDCHSWLLSSSVNELTQTDWPRVHWKNNFRGGSGQNGATLATRTCSESASSYFVLSHIDSFTDINLYDYHHGFRLRSMPSNIRSKFPGPANFFCRVFCQQISFSWGFKFGYCYSSPRCELVLQLLIGKQGRKWLISFRWNEYLPIDLTKF